MKDLLITAERLAERLADADLRIYDTTVFLEPAERGYRAVSGREKYLEGHIPGAAFLDQIETLSDTSTKLGFTLQDPKTLQAALGAAGVGNHTPVVLYSRGHMMWATRAWWLLHYAGHHHVQVLDGGFDAWRAPGRETTTEPSTYPAAGLDTLPRTERFVDRNAVLDAIGKPTTCTVNALSPEVYSGESKMSYGRKGHIAGSINLHYDDLLRDGFFRPADELSAALQAKGLIDADRVITYCGGGISATIDAFACLLVGQQSVSVYDGSMSEWVRDESLPMTTGSEP